MSMRNFWIEMKIDGRKTTVKTGPKGKKGGFIVEFFVKQEGKSYLLYTVKGFVQKDDTLRTEIHEGVTKELVASSTNWP